MVSRYRRGGRRSIAPRPRRPIFVAWAAGAAIALTVSGCAPTAVTASERAVAAKLRDPASATFTDVRETSAGFVC